MVQTGNQASTDRMKYGETSVESVASSRSRRPSTYDIDEQCVYVIRATLMTMDLTLSLQRL